MTAVDGYLFNALCALRSAMAAAKMGGDDNTARAVEAIIADVVRSQLFLNPIDEVTGD